MNSSTPLRVAVVAHDEAVRDSLAVLLNAAGCVALAFSSGAAFLAAPAARTANCLVLDEEIADMTIWEMLERLQPWEAPMKVAIFTGQRSAELVQRASRVGVVQILEAPLIAPGLMDFLGRGRPDGAREACVR